MPSRSLVCLVLCVPAHALTIHHPLAVDGGRRHAAVCMTDRSVQEAAKAAWLARQGNEPSWKQSQAAPEPETVLPDLREQLQSMDQELAESAKPTARDRARETASE